MSNAEFKRLKADNHNYQRWLRLNADYYEQRPHKRPIVEDGRFSVRGKALLAASLAMGFNY